MVCARNWVLRLIIHDYSLESQSTLNVKEVVFICVLQQHGWLTELPILLRALTLLLPILGWLTAGLVAPGVCSGRPGRHWQQAAERCHFAVESNGQKHLLSQAVCGAAFPALWKRKDSQWPLPNKPAPAHLCSECGTEWPRSGWKPLQIFPSKACGRNI